jgi:protein-tyrosine-phosphatase
MLAYMLSSLAKDNGYDWQLRSAGTHVHEGSAMSSRTKEALLSIPGLEEQNYGRHRSHQLTLEDLAWADIVLASEVDHVQYVRRNFPAFADETVLLGQFIANAPRDEDFATQRLVVASLDPDYSGEIIDPAGGDQEVYYACANELWVLAQAFAVLVAH